MNGQKFEEVTAKTVLMLGSIDASKIMSNSTDNICADISMNGQKLEEVTSFNSLGATLCKNGSCSAEIHIRIV